MIICYLPSEYVQYIICHMTYCCHILRRQYEKDSIDSHYIERDGMSLYEVEPDSYIGRLPFIKENYSTYGRSPWGVSCTYDELYILMSNVYFMSDDFTAENVPIQQVAKDFLDSTLTKKDDPRESVGRKIAREFVDKISTQKFPSSSEVRFNDGVDDDSSILSRFCEKYPFEFHSRFSPVVVTIPSLEYAYQASKATTTQDERYVLQAGSSLEAKRRGNEIVQRNDWMETSLPIMFSLALQYALSFTDVSSYLLSTGSAHLINSGVEHRDSYWADYNNGQNMLGKIWMIVRNLLNGYIVKGL